MPPAERATTPIRLFYSYSHRDEALRDELQTHLSLLQNQGIISAWHDRRIEAGTEWDGIIRKELDEADLILLLISADFVASRYIWDIEIKRAMQRHEEGTARVIPVILRPVDAWQTAPFGKLQGMPTGGKPVTEWKNRDRAFADVARGIREAIGGSQSEPVKRSIRSEAPFLVPFPRNLDFVGRAEDLKALHDVLGKREPVGIRPTGLTGMGGIGKTQLAVEYVYRCRDAYPDGIFWINAADPLVQGLAAIAVRLRPEVQDHPPDKQLRTAFDELRNRKGSLLVLDNLDDPAKLINPLSDGQSLAALGCRILFTTRQRELGRFHPIEVSVLPEEPALQLLLGHPRRHAIRDDPGHPDRPEAQAICRLLGWLPLALELAGAFLGENEDMPLADYREGLQREGCIPTIEWKLDDLSPVNFQPTHKAAVGATLKSQWDMLQKPGDEPARLVFQVAGQFGEAAGIPELSLGLLAGVSNAAPKGRLSPLRRTLKRLHDVRLVEELREGRVRLHPLVREFAQTLTPPEETMGFRHGCARNVVQALEDFAALEDAVQLGGVEGLEKSLETAAEFAEGGGEGLREPLLEGLRLLRREAHHLRDWNAKEDPGWFAGRVMFRAESLGLSTLAARAEQRVHEVSHPALLLRWRTLRESPVLLRLLTGHRDFVNPAAVSPDGRQIVSGSDDKTAAVWELESGKRLALLTLDGPIFSVAWHPDSHRLVAGGFWWRPVSAGASRAVRAVVKPPGRCRPGAVVTTAGTENPPGRHPKPVSWCTMGIGALPSGCSLTIRLSVEVPAGDRRRGGSGRAMGM